MKHFIANHLDPKTGRIKSQRSVWATDLPTALIYANEMKTCDCDIAIAPVENSWETKA